MLSFVPAIVSFFAALIMPERDYLLRIAYSIIAALLIGSLLLIVLQRPVIKRIEADIGVRSLRALPRRSIALIVLASFCLNAINCSIQFPGALGGYGSLHAFTAALPGTDLLGLPNAHPLAALAVLLYIVVLAPIIEENCFRGIIFPRLRYWIGAPAALLIQALLFALIHGNLPQAILAMPLGCFTAWCLLRFGNLKLAMLSHTVVNATGSFFGALAVQGFWKQLAPFILIAATPLLIFSLFQLRREAEGLAKIIGRELSPAFCKDASSGTDSSVLSDRGIPASPSRYAADKNAMPFPFAAKAPARIEAALINASRKPKRLSK